MGTRKKTKQLYDHGPLTPEILRTFEGFEETPDEEAYKIIWTLDAFSRIAVEYHHYINRPDKGFNNEESLLKSV